MEQANSFSAPLPTEFSSDFTTWLEKEKNEAQRHRSRVLKMAVASILVGTALVLLTEQSSLVQQIVEAVTVVRP